MSDRTLKVTLHIVGTQEVSADYLISEGREKQGTCSRQMSLESQPLLPQRRVPVP